MKQDLSPLGRRMVEAFGFPAAFVDLDAADMERPAAEYREALARVVAAEKRWAANADGEDLLLTGPFGAGKTRLAVWLARRLIEARAARADALDAARRPDPAEGGDRPRRPRKDAPPPLTRGGRHAQFVHARNLGKLRFEPGSEVSDGDWQDWADLTEAVETAHLLVLDDVGRIADYRGEFDFLEGLVEKRWEAGLPTLITCSGKLTALPDRFQDFLKQWTLVKFPDGDSFRRVKKLRG